MKKQTGYTLEELQFVVWIVAGLSFACFAGAMIYAAVHYIAKFW